MEQISFLLQRMIGRLEDADGAMLFPNGGSGIRVQGELELDDILPISIGAMPVFIRGTITKIDDGERLLLQMSKKITAIFNTTQLQYDVLIDFKTCR